MSFWSALMFLIGGFVVVMGLYVGADAYAYDREQVRIGSFDDRSKNYGYVRMYFWLFIGTLLIANGFLLR